jgi:hypothetical protein
VNERLQVHISKMNPYAGHVVIVGRADGKVLILGTPNPHVRLQLVFGASSLEHEVHHMETEHFHGIERDLVYRFRHLAEDCYGHWVMAEFRDVVAALEEYDALSGARSRCGGLVLGQTIFVHALGRGEITEFQTCRTTDRVRVRLHALGDIVAVPRRYVKPILRAGACA